MGKLFVILFSLFLFGCAGYEAPCVNDLWRISNTPYVLKVNDCCEHSCNYCNVLLTANVEAYVVVGHTDAYNTPHAWIMIITKGIEYFVDPTCGMKYKPATQWRDRTVDFVFNQGVTPKELRKYTNIKEVR